MSCISHDPAVIHALTGDQDSKNSPQDAHLFVTRRLGKPHYKQAIAYPETGGVDLRGGFDSSSTRASNGFSD